MSPLLNAPNVVSLSRLVLAVCFVVLRSPHARVALLLIAAATDGVDGWLARRSHSASRAGAMIDAVADRTFALVAVVVLLLDGALGLGESLILLSRDIATAIGFIVARIIPWLRSVPFKARFVGKAVTVLQYATMVVVLLQPSLTQVLLAAVAIASAVAIADYTLALWRARAR